MNISDINPTDIWPVDRCPTCGWKYDEAPNGGCKPGSCSERPVPSPTAKERFEQSYVIRELLADYAHEAWSGWMRYLFEKTETLPDGSVILPKWAVERWTRQMNTPYAKLPDAEKESDRKEADKMMLLAGVA